MNGRTAAALALVLGSALAAAGCSGSDGDAQGEGSTTTERSTVVNQPLTSFPPNGAMGPNPPAVESFELPATVTCTPGQPTDVSVNYKVAEKAMTVTFIVDMKQVESGVLPKAGSFAVPVDCDGGKHTVVLIAVGPDMSTTTRSQDITTTGA